MPNTLFSNVVVLMLENRSFDHVFGYLGIGEGVSKPYVNYVDPKAKTGAFSTEKGGDLTAVGQGPSHSLKQVNLQLFGKTAVPVGTAADSATMSGFATSFKEDLAYDLKRTPTDSEIQQVMNGFDPVQLPVLSTLARSFVLCDHWFADVPGPTMPNRAFVHAATSQGYTYNADWKPDFTCKTIYDRINDTPSLSWRVYYHDKNDVLELYPSIKKTPDNNVRFDTNFLADVAADKLATYSFITPAFVGTPDEPVNSMHAPPDVRPAEKLVADVYNALQSNPVVWKKTLFIIVFDEHGGYFDHVVPPATVSPDGIPGLTVPSYLEPFGFDRLGLRVPALLISPWLAAAVDSTAYSHSTIPGTLVEAFSLVGGALTKRDAQAAKLTRYFVDDGTRVFRTDTPVLTAPAQPQVMDAMQHEVLDGSVHLDPHEPNRTDVRTKDITDPAQAKQFVRTQVAKHLEHYFASGSNPKEGAGATMTAPGQPPSASVSPSRISQLRRTK